MPFDSTVQFITDNWQLVFGAGAVGTVIVGAIVGAWAKWYFEKKPKDTPAKSGVSQNIRAGSGSTNIQAGRDANLSGRPDTGKGRRPIS